MNIKVLGPGCQNCKNLHKAVQQAVEELSLPDGSVELEYLDKMEDIQAFPIFATPGLVIDGEVAHQGKPLPSVEKIRELINKALN